MAQLIGLTGQKGSGKSTLAEQLVQHHGFLERPLAYPLKKACQELFLLSDEQVFGDLKDKEMPDPRWFNCTPRRMLQFVGTDLLRDQLSRIMPGLGQDVFVHHFRLWYQDLLRKNPATRVVVSDLRFRNEVQMVHDLRGLVVRIIRPGLQSQDDHASEKDLENSTDFDCSLVNNGTREQLYQKFLENINIK